MARRLRLRYPATCSTCDTALEPGTSAWWDSQTKTARCETCETAPRGPTPEEPLATVATAPPSVTPPRAVAGGSAQHEFERRKAKHAAKVHTLHPHIGGLILALTEEPQTTKNWATGAEGEQKLGASLDSLAPAGVLALHDRLRPGTRANIDHLAVAPRGVWVIDAKRYRGEVTKKDVGGWLSHDMRLFVGRRDCTARVTTMAKQVDAVRSALGTEWAEVPVRPMLCFVDADWGWFPKPFELQGVVVTWPKAARELLVRTGPYVRPTVELIAATLEDRLRAAS